MSSRKQKKRVDLSQVIFKRVPEAAKVFISHLLNICRTNWYKRNKKLKEKDEILKDQILKILEFNPSYGHRRLAMALGVGKNRVRRVMKSYGIKPYKRKARWRKRRDYGKPEARFPNLIKGSCPIRPGIILVGDFTRIEYKGGIIYLATYMDSYTREIVGWNISTKHTSELVIGALFDAIKTLGRIPKIVHTDQGSEYNCKDYLVLVSRLGIQISMSKKASPWENAYQESFYDNFKTDLGLEFDRFQGIGELVEAINQTINYYNNQRIHTSLKMTPSEFKQKFLYQNSAV